MMAVLDPRHDMARFGAELFGGSPRLSDLMIVAKAYRAAEATSQS